MQSITKHTSMPATWTNWRPVIPVLCFILRKYSSNSLSTKAMLYFWSITCITSLSNDQPTSFWRSISGHRSSDRNKWSLQSGISRAFALIIPWNVVTSLCIRGSDPKSWFKRSDCNRRLSACCMLLNVCDILANAFRTCKSSAGED